jgi:hypothetical protein
LAPRSRGDGDNAVRSQERDADSEDGAEGVEQLVVADVGEVGAVAAPTPACTSTSVRTS